MALLHALFAALLTAHVHAGFKTSCTYDKEWSNSDRRMDSVTYSDLSGCQAETLGFGNDVNDITIGGEGSAAVIGIDAGGQQDGCDGGAECMLWCQAMCCMAKGCQFATIRRDTDTKKDYVVYTETVTTYDCRLYSAGKLVDSGSQSTCTKLGSNYCDDLAKSAFGLSTSEYNQLVSLSAYQTCPTSGRRLLLDGQPKVSSSKQIKASLNAFKKKFATLKANAQAAIKTGKMSSYINKSGICKA